jgi:aquaporin related protein
MLLAVAQILGGITAAAVVSCLFPGPLTVRTSLGGGTSVTRGLFIEMFLTAELVFTIFMLAAEKHKGTFIAPVGIGLSLFIAELTGVYFTGGSVNPARSFGPSVVSHKFFGYHWIYWVGPIFGSLLASGFYKFIKMLEYETANPHQDASKPEGDHFNPEDDGRSTPRASFTPVDCANPTMDGETLNGIARDYSAAGGSYNESPSLLHPNNQSSGPTEGDMHAGEVFKPTHSVDDSDQTLAPDAWLSSRGSLVHKSAIKPGSVASNRNGNGHGNGHGH